MALSPPLPQVIPARKAIIALPAFPIHNRAPSLLKKDPSSSASPKPELEEWHAQAAQRVRQEMLLQIEAAPQAEIPAPRPKVMQAFSRRKRPDPSPDPPAAAMPEMVSLEATTPPKRKRGRPRRHPAPEMVPREAKRKPGRPPRQAPEMDFRDQAMPLKRKPGRPPRQAPEMDFRYLAMRKPGEMDYCHLPMPLKRKPGRPPLMPAPIQVMEPPPPPIAQLQAQARRQRFQSLKLACKDLAARMDALEKKWDL
ncbi:basic proline-rich protein-like [Selaginella moellendorffii]|uniref:basic proline-rich protein-like n=1 Tax=Selaginella moellendorffii TaxID=88036 RepID=UPI000D1C8096|nr:basic proline-rich protein-like [Selaginella moellendorffii]|eukprot:XP_024532924.1 basic proline-rich protein-like [Selaginella moellendorffii]